MDRFEDSSAIAGDPAALAARLAKSGYLFFRGLLPVEAVNEAGRAVYSGLHSNGWIDAGGVPLPGRKALNSLDAREDPGFRAVKANPAFHRLAYLSPLRSLVRRLLGPQAFSYPVKVLRASYPEVLPAVARGRYVHQDYNVSCVQDMLTAWVPLMDIPLDLGGLAVLPQSHLGPPRPPKRLLVGEPGWATADYAVGDVLLFHCLTSHAALPNRMNALRVSTDFRFQPVEAVAPHELIYGPSRRRHEMYTMLLRRQPWWEPIPSAARTAPPGQRRLGPPLPSRFFQVHPAWASWQPRERHRPVH
ncbi:MAG TPA: phytanoyl-CoA dioxygenase family protein [Acidimicrobiales bacterium]|jgi:hypothetical protein|nr:phytanoyl-CoA dioxygenase family protein [Acidimicrobiales bacterium]